MSEHPNPSGLCMCGCGQSTPLARDSDPRRGSVRGLPQRFIAGHQSRKHPAEHVEDPGSGCWVWQRGTNGVGYGITTRNGHKCYAHRAYYEQAIGPIPEELELDHLCRNRACVNPAHLEPVTHAENARRGVTKRKALADAEAAAVEALEARIEAAIYADRAERAR